MESLQWSRRPEIAAFCPLSCDPDCLVQPPNSQMAPKSIGEGASSLFGGRPGSLENGSSSRATPELHRCNLEVALEQETFSRLPGLHPKRPLAPSPIDLGAIREFGGYTRGFFLRPRPPHTRQNMNKNMAPKLTKLPCFEAFGVIFCPDVCSYFCLVCGGRGSLAYF